ncbi:MAG: hypothetical protein R3178_09590, partial [Rhodothermales bacterium]|nr:hypothetical protein [Rhodothermales bacterium]
MNDAPKRPSAQPVDATMGELQLFAEEYEQDRKRMRIAFVAAVILHIILLLVTFPEMSFTRGVEREKAKVYVVQQVRFKPPPPQQQQEIPKPRSKKVPIPDPTPDEPEP